MLPFAGKQDTELRLGGRLIRPFVELVKGPRDRWCNDDGTFPRAPYEFHRKPIFLRWMDFGSRCGGFSLFPRLWGQFPQVPTTVVWLHLPEVTGKLHMMYEHRNVFIPKEGERSIIRPGQTWRNPEFVLTPHRHGWAKGIEPYREWVRHNYRHQHSVPAHVRDGLGYRTIWMHEPLEPRRAVWTFRELPALARECREHGLTELVAWWGFGKPTTWALTPLHTTPACGTMKDFERALAACAKYGVRFAPFVSFMSSYGDKQMKRHGWKVEPWKGNETYHGELIPRYNPQYTQGMKCTLADLSNPVWQADVKRWFGEIIERGGASFSWDQFFLRHYEKPFTPPPNMETLTAELRNRMKQRDPEAAFSAELLIDLEVASKYLDYTWNWNASLTPNFQPILSVMPAPRVNWCIDRSALEAKVAFADNYFLNVQPRKPDEMNGSDWIRNHRALSRALKQCAARRKQFLKYFVDGVFIGDCPLTKPAAEAHVSSYVLPDRVLTILVNRGRSRNAFFEVDLRPWLSHLHATRRCNARFCNEEGKVIRQATVATRGRISIPLKEEEMVFVEFQRETE